MTGQQILTVVDQDANDYAKYLAGKRVVFVGPAPHMEGSGRGALIDNYDVVVRVNKALQVSDAMSNDIGKRTDVLYNCLNEGESYGGRLHPEMLTEKGVKFLCCPYPEITPFSLDIGLWRTRYGEEFPAHIIDKAYYLSLMQKVNTRPNSGFAAIFELLCHPIKELFVTGVTFFKGGYFSAYRPMNEKQVLDFMGKYGNHQQAPQMALFKRLMAEESRLKVDVELKVIMDEVA